MKPGNGKDDRYYNEGSTVRPVERRWEETKTSAQEAVNRANSLGPRGAIGGILNRRPLAILALGISALIVLALATYIVAALLGRPSSQSSSSYSSLSAPARSAQPTTDGQPSNQVLAPSGASPSNQTAGGAQTAPATSPAPSLSQPQSSLASSLTPSPDEQSWPVRIALVALSMALASLLGAVLAFRPRKDIPASRRMPHVIQAEILLSVLGAGVVVVAATGIAVAAAVLALALFVRIRPAVRDPKESVVMLISAAVGVACGAQRWEAAIILAGLAFVILWVLEYPETDKAHKTIEVAVDTRNVHETNEVLRDVFERTHVSAEFRKVDRDGPDTAGGTIVYLISGTGNLGLDQLADEIFSSDPENVHGVSSHQSRTRQYDLSQV